jgi:1,4-alpha-glucan branching enzyme
MIRKSFVEVNGQPVARVTFQLPKSTWADTIYLVGDFNEWNSSSHPFRLTREGAWTYTLDLEVKRSYCFRYRKDGEWVNDGQADGYIHNHEDGDAFVVVTDPNFVPVQP